MNTWFIIYLLGIVPYGLAIVEDFHSWRDYVVSLFVALFWPILFTANVFYKILKNN